MICLVCNHVAWQQAPILLVARQPVPNDPTDTGMSFACGAKDHAETDWLVDRVGRWRSQVPELADLAPEQMATRSAVGQPWIIVHDPVIEEAA